MYKSSTKTDMCPRGRRLIFYYGILDIISNVEFQRLGSVVVGVEFMKFTSITTLPNCLRIPDLIEQYIVPKRAIEITLEKARLPVHVTGKSLSF